MAETPPPSRESPIPPPTPNQTRTRSGTGSSAGSSSARRAGAFADAGPAFDPGAPPPDVEAPPEPVDDGGLLVLWERDRVELLLRGQGEVVHTALAVDKESQEWRYTDGELDTIAPPLTNILNRYEPTRAAAVLGDEIALIVGLSGYVGRSVAARRAATRRQEEDEPHLTGVPAPEGTGPPVEPDLAPEDDMTPPPLGGRRR